MVRSALALRAPALAAALTLLCAASPMAAAPLNANLVGRTFLIGDWSAETGRVAETGGTSSGASHIEPVADGAALLR